MQRYSKYWWAAILLSSAVTGGGTFVLLLLLTDFSVATVLKISVALVLIGDFVLAIIMQTISPTRVEIGPGERWHTGELPKDIGVVKKRFENGRGRVTIRGETWNARQTADTDMQLEVGEAVRIVEREGLTLVVEAALES